MANREPNEKATIGDQKVSVTVTRKTSGDLLVSQHSSERWFAGEQAAVDALGRILEVFIEPERIGSDPEEGFSRRDTRNERGIKEVFSKEERED